MPVAASTICLLMLSLDRYATVKHPRLAQLRKFDETIEAEYERITCED